MALIELCKDEEEFDDPLVPGSPLSQWGSSASVFSAICTMP